MVDNERAAPDEWLRGHRDDLIELARRLISFSSENRPPHGQEGPCQEFIADHLADLGLAPDVFRPDEVSGAVDHPSWWPGRDYAERPNVTARLPGRGGGRSLLFSGHVDVVPALGAGVHGYWDGVVEDGRLYGRGALDMKGAIACYLHALRCVIERGSPLAGDLLVETTVDEEFGGANGTLACRLRGYSADGAVLGEPTGLRACHATRGGIQYRLEAVGEQGGMDFGSAAQPHALPALARAAVALAAAEGDRGAPIYQFLLRAGEELPWGTAEGTPTTGVLEFWAEVLPGVSRDQLDAELRAIIEPAAGGGVTLRWEQRTRFLPALTGDPDAPIVVAMRAALGPPGASPHTAPFACDGFMFAFGAHPGTPVVVCGPGGANPHAPDEYVTVDDLHALAAAYVRLALGWCGVP